MRILLGKKLFEKNYDPVVEEFSKGIEPLYGQVSVNLYFANVKALSVGTKGVQGPNLLPNTTVKVNYGPVTVSPTSVSAKFKTQTKVIDIGVEFEWSQ